MRRSQVDMGLGRLENRGDGFGHPLIFVLLGLELLEASGGELVAANLAPGVRPGPLRLDPPTRQQLLQSWIERPLLYAQLVARQVANALSDGIAMQRAWPQHAKDQHHEGARRQAGGLRHRRTMPL